MSKNTAGWIALDSARRLRSLLQSTPRSVSYPVIGAVLALGAPVGLLFVRVLEAGGSPWVAWALDDVDQLTVTYAYVTLSTLVALASLGYLLGRWFDHVRLQSITDPLTGLFNRRHFGRRLDEELRRGDRYGRTACLLSVDIDHLKVINDGFGHKAGDQALVAVGQSLVKSVRSNDAVARVSGDEFAVLLPETSVAQAAALSLRILAEVARQGNPSIGTLAVSIGVAELSATANMSYHDVLAAADAALYRAKAAGGGHAAIAQPPEAGPHGRFFTLTEATLLLENQTRAGACG